MRLACWDKGSSRASISEKEPVILMEQNIFVSCVGFVNTAKEQKGQQ